MADSDKETGFAFDLFSDIAPLLALFGDQFARQFASESLTWVDHLILAMVPLGILTVITGAIRVQGPRIAKSFIGRGRENRALAEIELMSSTSKEVCELFNGKSIIRAMGNPRIAQILVFPDEYNWLEYLHEVEDITSRRDATATRTANTSCGIHSLKTAVSYPNRPLLECVAYHSYSYMVIMKMIRYARLTLGITVKDSKPNTQTEFDWLGAPNIQLGLASNQYDPGVIRKGHEVFLAAIAAVLLQLSLIAIATVTVYHSPTRRAISIEPENYGYPCYIVGTVFLCIGIAICSIAIERNTTELEWRVLPLKKDEGENTSRVVPTSKYKPGIESAPRLLWLQQSQEVNDQAFQGYAILAGPKYHVITSSRLEDAERHRVKNSPDAIPETPEPLMETKEKFTKGSISSSIQGGTGAQESDTMWEISTVCAVVAAGLGFVVQFMGLRGLAYPCSIAQLIAILLMALIRALIRRRLGRIPRHCVVFAGYEMDFLATRLVHCKLFRNYHAGIDQKECDINQSAAEQVLRWQIRTAKNMETSPFRFEKPNDIVQRLSNQRSMAVSSTNRSTTNTENFEQDPGAATVKVASCKTGLDAAPSCQQLVRVRERLADLCLWKSKALDSALSVAASIEAFMEMFFSKSSTQGSTSKSRGHIDHLDWVIETVGPSSTNYVTIPIRRSGDHSKWEADIGKLEAILSLWMATIEAQSEATKRNSAGTFRGPSAAAPNWRRSKAGTNLHYKFCRILGDDSKNGPLKRDLSWWVDELIADQSDNPVASVESWSHSTESSESTGDDEQSPRSHNENEAHKPPWIANKARDKEAELIIGFNGHQGHIKELQTKCNGIQPQVRELAVKSAGLLPVILAQHLFTSFMWRVVDELPNDCLRQGFHSNEQEVEIEGRHTFDIHEFQDTWHRPTLRHRGLTKLVRELEKNGLGKYVDILLCMIPALSSKDLLPNHIILKLIPPMRRDQSWTTVARCYSRLLKTNIRTNPPELFCYSVVVEAMDFLQFSCEPYDQFFEPHGELKDELRRLVDRLASQDYEQILKRLAPVYAIQQRWTRFLQIFDQYGTSMLANQLTNTDAPSTLPDAYGQFQNMTRFYKEKVGAIDLDFCVATLALSRTFGFIYVQLEYELDNSRGDIPFSVRRRVRPLQGRGVSKDTRLPDLFGWTPLHYAALLKTSLLAEYTINHSLDGEHMIHQVHDKFKRSPIHVAVATCNLYVLEVMLAKLDKENKNSALNASGLDQMTLLHLSVKSGSEKCVKHILDQGVPEQTMHQTDFWGREPIHLAASFGYDAIARLLLEKGSLPYSVDELSMSPMDYLFKGDADLKTFTKTAGDTAECGPQVIKVHKDLLAHPQEPAVSDSTESSTKSDLVIRKREIFVKFALRKPDFHDRLGYTFLHHAVQQVDIETVRSLIQNGYDRDERDSEGRSALHLAILAGRREMALLLLGDGGFFADPSAQDNQKETVMMLAARQGDLEIVKRLVVREYSTDPNIKLPENESPTDWTFRYVEKGCDPHAQDSRGRTALHIALEHEKDDVAVFLLGINPPQDKPGDDKGWSLLLTACKNTLSVVCVRRILCRWPKTINDTDPDYDQTPLSWACEQEKEGIVNELLKSQDINVNKPATGWRNYTPLHFASSNGNNVIVDLLLGRAEIDVSAKDKNGETALDIAIERRDPKIAESLLASQKMEFETRLSSIKKFCVHSFEDMHAIVPAVFEQIRENIGDGEIINLVSMSEHLRRTELYSVFAQQALAHVDTRKKLPQPMHTAARLGDLNKMRVLFNEGIQPSELDDDGWTCIEYANTYRNEKLGDGFTDFVKGYATSQSQDPHRALPNFWDYDHFGSGIELHECSVRGHQDCAGFHTVRVGKDVEVKAEVTAVPESASIRTTKCAPPLGPSRKLFYYEVTVIKESKSGRLGIGFCDKSYSQTDMPGWHDISFGYLSDDGLLYINKPEHGQELADDLEGNGKYGSGDTVGVGLDLETGEGFITYNGKKRDVGNAFENDKFNGRKMYPCIGFDVTEEGEGLHFEVNLGASPENHPFKYQAE